MDLDAVAVGLRDAAKTVTSTPKLTCFEYLPDSIPAPAFCVGDVRVDFDKTFARGMDEVVVTCMVLLGRSDDKASQKRLNGYLSGSGVGALKQALEADGTLGGACDDVHVRRVQGRRYYQVGDTQYVGAELEVFVIGDGS